MDVQKIRADSNLIGTDSSRKEKKKKLLREIMVKIGLKQEDDEEGIVVEMLLDSGTTWLVISSEFVRKNKLDRLLHMKNVDGTFNYKGPIKHMVEVELFFKGHKERTEIDVIGGQKQSIILRILWLAFHNPEIDWKTREVKIMRCLDKCRKQWKTKQMKPE